MNLLVTGVAGFIGSNFVYYYLDQYPDRDIIGLDDLTYAGNLGNLGNLTEEQKERFRFIRGDITDASLVDEIFSRYEVDRVINFAAESHVDRSIHDPLAFLRTNIIGTSILLESARSNWMKNEKTQKENRFLQISTDEVYGSLGSTGLFTESTPLDPHSPYSASKASADLIAKAYFDTYRMPVLITRCSNNYGPYQFPEKLVPLIIRNALVHQPVPVYGNGTQVRDWLYVKDHCRAVDRVMERGEPGRVYNIGGNNEWKNIDFVKLVIRLLHQETGDPHITEGLIRFVRDRPGHDRRYAIDSDRIQKELGWRPETPFIEGITFTVRWYLENQHWVEDVVSGDYLSFYQKNYG